MGIIAICISLFAGIVSWRAEKNLYNPGSIMGFLWALICYMAYLRAYNLFETSEFVYLLVSIGIACFCLGCFVCRWRKVYITRGAIPRILHESKDAELSRVIIRILCVLSVLLLSGLAISNIKLLMSGIDMSDIRGQEDMYNYNNVIFDLLNNYIVKPFSFAILPIFAVDFFLSEKVDKVIATGTIIIVIERVLIEGGRVVIIYVLSALIISLSVIKRQQKIRTKRVWFLLGLIIVSSVAIYFVTISRGIESDEQGRSLYRYICGCLPHLTVRLEKMQNLDTYTYGFASMNGIVHYIASLLENVTGLYPDFLQEVRELIYVEDRVSISSDYGQFNAFVSPLFYMYLDGRVLGVAVGMFLYGFFSYRCYEKTKRGVNSRDLAVYLLIVQGLATTMVRMQFSQVHYSVAFLFIMFLINQKREVITPAKSSDDVLYDEKEGENTCNKPK